jgi:hypothetical protein
VSTVLWANLLVSNRVTSAQADLHALYKHADKLDALSKSLGVTHFLSICDMTDVRCNHAEVDLPVGMKSTDELMAVQGSWVAVADAIAMLETLRNHIVKHKVRFGMLSNQHGAVVAELAEAISYAQSERSSAQKFNFSVVE